MFVFNREKELFQARTHYTKAAVDGLVFDLFDDANTQVIVSFFLLLNIY